MNFLPFDDEINAVNSCEPKLRSKKSKNSLVSFNELNDNWIYLKSHLSLKKYKLHDYIWTYITKDAFWTQYEQW